MSYFDVNIEQTTTPEPGKHKVGDFTPFYVAIGICSVVVGFLFLLNLYFCCSRYHSYWLDHNTGNRWLLPVWTKTPHQQPPLDCTELEGSRLVQLSREQQEVFQPAEPVLGQDERQQFFELRKRESDL
ncbi:uncharacterized protein LOC134542022 [Bacillus rossius redtenbacheri]|uniref:uncharacterized protein LOC134542022 n=1 Tax=Bacillus rossius redtenbacheri TaxID=93214 RepID=UPI002FDDABF1